MERLEGRVVRDAEAADARQRLRKSTDDEIDLVEHACGFGAAQTASAVRAERVRFVDEEEGSHLATNGGDLGERRLVAADRVETFDDHEAPAGIDLSAKLASQIRCRVVAKSKYLRAAQPRPVVDAGVTLRIQQHD